MKNLQKITSGLNNLFSKQDLQLIIEEAQEENMKLVVEASHTDQYGEADNYTYSWFVPTDMWGTSLTKGDWIEVECCGSTDYVIIQDIYFEEEINCPNHSFVIRKLYERMKEPLFMVEDFKPIFIWDYDDVERRKDDGAELFTKEELVRHFRSQASKGVLSFSSYHLITSSCFGGVLSFLKEYAPFLAQLLETIGRDWDEVLNSEESNIPFYVTEDFLFEISEDYFA
jgi:hypothetical protein